MPKVTKPGLNKEIERLKAGRKKAQDKGDISEEAKICNTIGELYTQDGDYSRALYYHQAELALSEGGVDLLGAAIAHRRVGECHCELGSYEEAVLHQSRHLDISRQLGNLVEEQRALATLGRTYFVQSQSEFDQCGRNSKEIMTKATTEYLCSLDVCDKLIGHISDRELLEMKSRLYLNLGLVYESQGDTRNARKFMEKALGIVKELGESSTVFKCHFDLGSLHLKEHHPSLALNCFKEALTVAKDKKSELLQAEALREMGQAYAHLGDFQSAKSSLKKVTSMSKAQIEQELVWKDLKAVRKIIHYSSEVERAGVKDKLQLYDKLGDLCCGVRALSSAIKFYGLQLNLAETHGLEPKELSPIYVSLARTHTDCGQFSQALLYYHKELDLWKGNSVEECDTWSSIAKVNVCAKSNSKTVLDAFRKAYSFAEKANSAKRQVSLCKAIRKYCQSEDDLLSWESTLASLLEAHPELGESSCSSEEESESQGMDELSSDPPSSLPSSDSEDDDDTPTQTRSSFGVAVRKKSKIKKRNEKGETLLHVASIEGNAALVKQLVREGAEVNVRDHCGWTPLHEACNHGYMEVVQVLLDHGAMIDDPGGTHCGGVTPLMDGAINGHVDIVSLLIERGTDINIRNSNGQTALSVLEDKLLSESGSSYDLEDEHRAIRDLLKRERKRRGDSVGTSRVDRSKVKVAGVRAQPSTSNVQSSAHSVVAGSLQSRSRGMDRTGAGVLYSSDEEDTSYQPKHSLSTRTKSSNPFEHFTVGGGQSDRTSLPTVSSTPHSRAMSSGGTNVETSPTSHRKGFFNPLGQVEIPSLLPEEDSEEDGSSISQHGDHPVIDGWLINDMGQPPPAKRKRRQDDNYTLEGGGSKKPPSSKSLVRLESNSGRRSGSQLRFRKSPSVTRTTTQTRVSHGLRGKHLYGEGSGSSDVIGGLRSTDRSVTEIESDDGLQLDNDDIMLNENFGSMFAPSSSTQPFGYGLGNSSTLNDTVRQNPTTSSAGHAQSAAPDGAPLRIRVRIETKSHLIPCPRKQEDGMDTTIAWLVKQATDRYYTQEGVRPELSLTTLDGALLCPTDPVVHVLGENEEVVGVVEQWHLPPLGERYEMACRTGGKQCHKKTLTYFKSNTNSSAVDLSDFNLSPAHCGPIFQALQGQLTLTSLSLSGNRVGDEGMKQLSSGLSRHASLHVLDLSCTAVTNKGIEHLTRNIPSGLFTGLRSLDLSYNNLGVASGCGLVRILEQCKGLQELSLESCEVTCAVFKANPGLMEAIKALSCLKSLSVAGNNLGLEGASCLLHSLPSGLSRLNLNGTCSSGPSIIQAFQECSESFNRISKTLETLSISYCSVTGQCLTKLIAILEGCDSLKDLSLAGNSLDSDSMHPLCRYISLPSLSPTIQSVDLSGHCRIRAEGVEQLLTACHRRRTSHSVPVQSSSMLKLILSGCGLESPLPPTLITAVKDLVIVTNGLKAKQTCSNQFVVMLELCGNSVDKTDLLLLSS